MRLPRGAHHPRPPAQLQQIRFAWVRDRRWELLQFRRMMLLPRQWIRLEAEVNGDQLLVKVGGHPLPVLIAPRPLDGRVGLVKFRDTSARFRGWRWEPM